VAAKRTGSFVARAPMIGIDRLVCRRSPHLVCYWRGADFVIENYATTVRVGAQPITSDILGFFDDWRRVDALLALRPSETHDTLRTLIAQLLEHSLLQRSDRKMSERERAMTLWDAWNPAAGFFHVATKDVDFVDMNTQVRSLRERSRAAPMPNPVKRYRGARRIALTSSNLESEFPRALLTRRTWRRFSRKPVDLPSFGTLLGLTAGIQQWAHAEGEGRIALKTSPSGGARHAIELYTLALGVEHLPRGLYHYAADAHALELIDSNVSSRLIARYLPNQPWYKPAGALVFFAPVFPRELWRYRYARAYRAVLIEAGHLCQTFCLTATWLGLAPFCTMALADSLIEKDLGLDGITESVLYVAGVGTRPPDATARPPEARTGKPSMLKRLEVRTFPGRIVRSS
jgi:SagB-type dehydrogenase family enzyme